jgi:hypothetical protein
MHETVLKNLREEMDIGVRVAMLTYSQFINIGEVTCTKADIPDIESLIRRAGFRLMTSSIFEHEHVSFYASISADEEDTVAYDPLAEEQLGISARTFRDTLMTKVRIKATEVISFFTRATYRGGKGDADRWKILATNLAPIVKREVIRRLESDGFRATETIIGNDGFIIVSVR